MGAPITGRRIRLGSGFAHVRAFHRGARYVTEVDTAKAPARRLFIATGSTVASARLDGRRVRVTERLTSRGVEVTAPAGPGEQRLVVRTG